MARHEIDAKLANVEAAQRAVLIGLTTWIRNPSKLNRERLDEALIARDDIEDSILCPERLTQANLSPR